MKWNTQGVAERFYSIDALFLFQYALTKKSNSWADIDFNVYNLASFRIKAQSY